MAKEENKNHVMRYFIIILILVICALGGMMYYKIKSSKAGIVITVSDISFDNYDYMMYLKLAKDNYFTEEVAILTEEQLNRTLPEKNITLREYLKQTAQDNVITAGIIQKIATENNITLSTTDFEDMTSEKKDFINILGGTNAFKEWLKANKTNEVAYDKMHKTEKLYNKIYKELFSEGKSQDLTEAEKLAVQQKYSSEYAKIKQIILLTTNINTGEGITQIEKDQKKLLAQTIYEELINTDFVTKFDDYIRQYNVDEIKTEEPYSVYVKPTELVEPVKNAIDLLKLGEMSNVIESDYAYHIILKEELDKERLNTWYEEARQSKYSAYIAQAKTNAEILIGNVIEIIDIQ